ncbi:MAG TPA: hypothetical protein VJ256_06160, partial [Dehalococcoidia bacterium]|nr:hypothetical protein [Dehalococcoidia bacterium]
TRNVRGLWHNSFDDIVGGRGEAVTASLVARLAPLADSPLGPHGLPLGRPAAMVVASVPQGRRLRGQAEALGWQVNRPFPQVVMLEKAGPRRVLFEGGLTLTVLGPSAQRLEKLQREWDEVITDRGLAEGQREGRVAALVDESVFNLSSIVVMAESESKRILLTGDARGDDLLEGLRAAGLMDGGAVHLDVLKVPHHGSSRNVDEDFFRQVTADHYIVSADGKHGNPDVETLRLLTEAHGPDRYTLHFTNRQGEGDLQRHLGDFFNSDRRNSRQYEVRYRADAALSLAVDLGSQRHV